ncbi:rac GTPase-activating protein 1-like [Sitophilus oryzae]|uniref:Rac GTPase-activating protein 1-like n=1 Tax=Sitophilus oryzae TaxID=7048 RepID=A0A6J2XWW2_SITOR|nr:rac GTPase-activating protein 1-like [Sitophilus oryzae]
MSDHQFKTPLSHNGVRSNDYFNTPKFSSGDSDSEGSTTSAASGTSSTNSGSSSDLSLVVLFDDLIRSLKYRRDKKTEDAFLNFAEEAKNLLNKYNEALCECVKLQGLLDKRVQENSEIEIRLNRARHILDQEKRKTQKVMREKEILESNLEQVKELLFHDDGIKIGQDTREKLSFLQKSNHETNGYGGRNLCAINENNTTGSMLSDFSVSRSEDDLDVSRYNTKQGREWKKHRASTGVDPEPAQKKRKSSTSKVIEIGPSDTVRATTTVTVIKKGPITASSTIETIPHLNNNHIGSPIVTPNDDVCSNNPSAPPPHLVFESWARNDTPRKPPRSSALKSDHRPHFLQPKTIVVPDSCVYCQKKIRFGKTALKCKECKSVCHVECRDNLPLPCIPVLNTPNHKHILGIISDYTPTTPPMVPALIMHCINEIELRGLNELGLYRISAAEKDVKMLKEKFLKGRTAPSINQLDIHVICGCVKDFLRGLTEPITSYHLRNDFVQAVEARDRQDMVPALKQCISELPRPNRDTLAYLILHLQKVADSPDCKMPLENLARVFGPTVVGFSSEDPEPNNLLTETRQQIMVMEQLISLPNDYWSSFLNVNQNSQPVSRGLQQTPSTDSLLKPDGRFFTPRSKRAKRQRVFATPPAYKT